jgi:hypothetical protein
LKDRSTSEVIALCEAFFTVSCAFCSFKQQRLILQPSMTPYNARRLKSARVQLLRKCSSDTGSNRRARQKSPSQTRSAPRYQNLRQPKNAVQTRTRLRPGSIK